MKRLFLGIAALALLFTVTETASARPRYGINAGYGWGGPYAGVSYGTRVGNNGFLSVGYSTGFGGYGYYPSYGYSYPSYGYSYAPTYYSTPAYDSSYSTPVYSSSSYTTPVYTDTTYTTPVYTTPVYSTAPVYYSTPAYYGGYYGGPSIGFSYYNGGGRGRGWRWR
jgi:hypothetical protein